MQAKRYEVQFNNAPKGKLYQKKENKNLLVGIRQKALSFYSKVSILVRKRITMITCEMVYKFKLRVFQESRWTLVAGC